MLLGENSLLSMKPWVILFHLFISVNSLYQPLIIWQIGRRKLLFRLISNNISLSVFMFGLSCLTCIDTSCVVAPLLSYYLVGVTITSVILFFVIIAEVNIIGNLINIIVFCYCRLSLLTTEFIWKMSWAFKGRWTYYNTTWYNAQTRPLQTGAELGAVPMFLQYSWTRASILVPLWLRQCPSSSDHGRLLPEWSNYLRLQLQLPGEILVLRHGAQPPVAAPGRHPPLVLLECLVSRGKH